MHKLTCSLVCALVAGVLFFALSPGVLLTLPPAPTPSGEHCKHNGVFIQLSTSKYAGGCSTSYATVGVHAAVFAVVCGFLCYFCCDRMH